MVRYICSLIWVSLTGLSRRISVSDQSEIMVPEKKLHDRSRSYEGSQNYHMDYLRMDCVKSFIRSLNEIR